MLARQHWSRIAIGVVVLRRARRAPPRERLKLPAAREVRAIASRVAPAPRGSGGRRAAQQARPRRATSWRARVLADARLRGVAALLPTRSSLTTAGSAAPARRARAPRAPRPCTAHARLHRPRSRCPTAPEAPRNDGTQRPCTSADVDKRSSRKEVRRWGANARTPGVQPYTFRGVPHSLRYASASNCVKRGALHGP